MNCKEIQPVHPKGDQSWVFTGSWNSNTLATWYEELTHWKRPWCWQRLKAGGEGDYRGWDGWMASLTWVMDMSLSKLRELVRNWEAWRAAVHGVTKSWTRLSNWTEQNHLLSRKESLDQQSMFLLSLYQGCQIFAMRNPTFNISHLLWFMLLHQTVLVCMVHNSSWNYNKISEW